MAGIQGKGLVVTINAAEHISELGEAFNLKLSLDEEGLCELAIGDEYPLSIRLDSDMDAFVISSVVADELPDPVSYSLVQDMLELNLGPAVTGSPGIGMDPATGLIVSWQIVTEGMLSKGTLSSIVHAFLSFVVGMHERIREAAEASGGTGGNGAPAENGDPAFDPHLHSGFLPV
ncbi:MAG TPA: hypothetical protein DEO49_06310 [Sutterella sp.]|nr:hypothetical protein [Sutterella sp.]